MKFQQWHIHASDEGAVRALMEAGYPYLISTVLAPRGVSAPEEAESLLHCGERLTLDPLLMRDMDKAVDVLRTRGLAAVAKKAGRATNEGTVMAIVNDACTTGAVVELNCETDFVGMNEKFKAYAEKIAKAALAAKPADVDALKAAVIDGETVEEIVTDCIHVMGENTQLARVAVVDAQAVSAYIHGGDIAMQVAALNPVSATREDVPADVAAHEMEIYKAQAAESGKPEAIQEKMATGRLEKFFKESTLTEQAFVKNPDQSVSEYTDEVAKNLGGTIGIVDFKRFVLGEEA